MRDKTLMFQKEADEIAERAYRMGCVHSTQGGGMPSPRGIEQEIARQVGALAGLTGNDWNEALRSLAAEALFGSARGPKDKPTSGQEHTPEQARSLLDMIERDFVRRPNDGGVVVFARKDAKS